MSRVRIRVSLLAPALLFVAALPALAQQQAAAADAHIGPNPAPEVRARFEDVDIKNFGVINARYLRGSQPEAEDWATLAGVGVRTIIDLQADYDPRLNEQALVEKTGMRFVRIPMTTRVPPTQAQIEQFLKIVTDPASQPVYVHCQGGKHRTGVMTAIYRMTQDGWTGKQAFAEMKRFNYGPDFLHPEFKKFVLGFTPTPAPAPGMAERE